MESLVADLSAEEDSFEQRLEKIARGMAVDQDGIVGRLTEIARSQFSSCGEAE
jgi:hypothetical protein